MATTNAKRKASTAAPQNYSANVGRQDNKFKSNIKEATKDGTSAHERRWAAMDDNFYAANKTHEYLPPGLYRCAWNDSVGAILKKTLIDTDMLLELPDSASSKVIGEIRKFWELAPMFKERGLLHKRGVLMYGAPGSGKSSTVQLLIKDMITEYNGLALYIDNPKLASSCLQMVRTIEPSRPIVALFEDFDSLIDEYGENEFLALLDGEAQVDNIVFVGTTNYPEELDRRFVDRPSRFDLVIQVGMPTAAARHLYLKNKEPSLTEAELKEWVEQSDGYSIAHLRELIILCKCYQYSLKDAVHRLYTMRTQKLTSANMDFGVQAKVGFLE